MGGAGLGASPLKGGILWRGCRLYGKKCDTILESKRRKGNERERYGGNAVSRRDTRDGGIDSGGGERAGRGAAERRGSLGVNNLTK